MAPNPGSSDLKPTQQFTIFDEAASTRESDMTNNKYSPQSSEAVHNASNLDHCLPLPLLTTRLANQQTHGVRAVESSKKSKSGPILPEKISANSQLTQLVELLPAATEDKAPSKTRESVNLFALDDVEDLEILRLRHELSQAKQQIAQMDEELSQQRLTHQTVDSVLSLPLDDDSQLQASIDQRALHDLWGVRNGMAALNVLDSSTAQFSSHVGLGYEQKLGDNVKLAENFSLDSYDSRQLGKVAAWNNSRSGGWPSGDHRGNSTLYQSRYHNAPPHQNSPGFQFDTAETVNASINNVDFSSIDGRYRTGPGLSAIPSTMGSIRGGDVTSINVPQSTSFSPPVTPTPFSATALQHVPFPCQSRQVGTNLSPTAMEFNANGAGLIQAGPWNSQIRFDDVGSTNYIPPTEPMNYRRLLDRNMSCNWKYIVDKIVCSNDQQASIFLQQKLKVATPEQKHELIEAIISQAYPLMVNRFGNFLIQRCFEHGTTQQIIAIADAIRGNTLNLSMDAFGCHVVQKAFDVVPEEYKAHMVHELLRRIPETVIHRYACHVWQKLFELRWNDSPPQIMKYVNEALRGMWHEVALGETGSLVVQNIFENCLEEDKRPCIDEVLARIDVVSHGQFGNWCIQHICEHGLPTDKSRAIEHVLCYATEYSTDQFASKVVEKCLKVAGTDFVDRYLARVCEGRPDRPRMPLIDIAGDQYGNYLIQYILTNASPQHRDTVSNHIRKHMVSLRGSKFGSRVAMLCTNPGYSTRSGPPGGIQLNNRFNQMTNQAMGSTTAYQRSAMGPYR